MSNNLENNKIFAAILVAGITAMLAGFFAHKIVHPKMKPVEGVAEASVGAASAPIAEALPEPILALVAGADVERGKKLFKACAACHSVNEGGPHGVGPNMWGVMDRGVAAIDAYSYSDALTLKAGEKWDYLALNKFLWKPKKAVPGTKMNYIGLKKPADRAAMVAYLRSLSSSPVGLPSDADIAAEEAELLPAEEAEETLLDQLEIEPDYSTADEKE